MKRSLIAALLAALVIAGAAYVGWHSRPYVVTGIEWIRQANFTPNMLRIEYRKPLGGTASVDIPVRESNVECWSKVGIGFSIPKACW